MYIYAFVCVYICRCVYIYTHTIHTHTCLFTTLIFIAGSFCYRTFLNLTIYTHMHLQLYVCTCIHYMYTSRLLYTSMCIFWHCFYHREFSLWNVPAPYNSQATFSRIKTVCMYVCVYVCMYACMYVFQHLTTHKPHSVKLKRYVCMYVCMHVCMCSSTLQLTSHIQSN